MDAGLVAAEFSEPLEIGNYTLSVDGRHVRMTSYLGSKQMQRFRQALCHMSSAVVKTQTRPGNKIAHRIGDEDLASACHFGHARRDVDGDTANIVALNLDVAGMEAAAHIHAERAHSLDDRRGAAHGAGRPIKGREKAVAQSLHLAPAKPAKLLADSIVVPIAQKAPVAVAELGGPLCRVD